MELEAPLEADQAFLESDQTAAAAHEPARGPEFDLADVPLTGDARVDEVLGRLHALSGATIPDQVAVYDDVQRGLHACLSDVAPQPSAGRPG